MNAAVSGTRGVPDTESNWDYEVKGTSIKADLLSIPKEGGTFEVAKYLDPQLAAYFESGPAALSDPLVAAAAASQTSSCQIATGAEYAATIARLYTANMAVFSSEKAQFPLGLFAVPKFIGGLRLIVEGRRRATKTILSQIWLVQD